MTASLTTITTILPNKKIRVYPFSKRCPGWLIEYIMTTDLFDKFHRAIHPEIDKWMKIQDTKQRFKYVVDLAKSKGITEVKYDRGRVYLILDYKPDMLLAALSHK